MCRHASGSSDLTIASNIAVAAANPHFVVYDCQWKRIKKEEYDALYAEQIEFEAREEEEKENLKMGTVFETSMSNDEGNI